MIASFSPCANSNLCSGHGICNSISSKCDCFTGFKGESCDEIDEDKTCQFYCSGHGRCITSSLTSPPHCECDDAWKGEGCEISECDVDYMNQPCSSQGVCLSSFNNYTNRNEYNCVCDNSFRGRICEIQVIPCAQNCSIHGKCLDGECSCDNGWSGSTCTVELSPAESKQVECCPLKCSDNGQCDMVACKCVCAVDWSGPACNVFAAGDETA